MRTRKWTALVMALLMVMSTAAFAVTASAEEASGDIAIGVIFYSNTDDLGMAVDTLTSHAGDALGVDVTLKIANTAEDQLQACSDLISSGCDGIIAITVSDGVSQSMAEECDDAGVKFALTFRDIDDPEIKEEVMSLDNFVGMVYEDETESAVELVSYLADAGRDQIGVGYLPSGSASFDAKNAGIDEGMEEYGLTKLAEYTTDLADANAALANVQDMVTAYPDMDGLLLASGSAGRAESILNYLESSVRNISIALFDTFTGMEEAFDNGYLLASVGGSAPDALYAFMLVYNACNGTPVSDGALEYVQPYLFITNADEAATFTEYFGNPDDIVNVYSADFITSTLSKENNPDLDADSLGEIIESYSVEWIEEQVG